MEKECKYCKRLIDYKKPQQFGAHLTNCKFNPKRSEILKKIKEGNIVKRFEYVIKCKRCNKNFIVHITKSEFKRNSYKKYCSDKCARSRTLSVETKEKIKNTLLSKKIKSDKYIERPNCIICGKKVKKVQNIYCSNKCKYNSKIYKDKLSKLRIEKLKLYPELHPNRLCAGIKESYAERMLRLFFEENNLVNNVDFIQQYQINKYFVDFYIPMINLSIEVDGEYWHDLTSDREIKRSKIIKRQSDLIRFKAKDLIKKKYHNQILEIINKIKVLLSA